ncbi:unnamed protein product [Debaryomyces tyrocola]|nr:unnamed protein product [Debaryomyces tyrocola]
MAAGGVPVVFSFERRSSLVSRSLSPPPTFSQAFKSTYRCHMTPNDRSATHKASGQLSILLRPLNCDFRHSVLDRFPLVVLIPWVCPAIQNNQLINHIDRIVQRTYYYVYAIL